MFFGHVGHMCGFSTITVPWTRVLTNVFLMISFDWRPKALVSNECYDCFAIHGTIVALHKTSDRICESCKKLGHTAAQCWSAHLELVPEALLKKRKTAMYAIVRKRRRAANYISPDYQFQGMAFTYKRPLPTIVQRRSTRPAQPASEAGDAAVQ